MLCRHRRAADSSAEEELRVAGVPASVQAVLIRQRLELKAALRLEDLLFKQKGGARLDRPPVRHDWCAAWPGASEGRYFFCDWLEGNECSLFQCATGIRDCPRCETGQGTCISGAEGGDPPLGDAAVPRDTAPLLGAAASISTSSPGTMPSVRTTPSLGTVPAPDRMPPAPHTAEHAWHTDTPRANWSLPLGPAFALRTVQQPLAIGEGGFQLDYKFEELTHERPAIRGRGLAQTYMIFGGPGAGKTYYFKYLLKSLLSHPDRPGCLMLDPKGVLTKWLRKELGDIGRADDFTVLEEDARQPAFNVLGADLQPAELGRLLSEVVLAGADGVSEDWGVLITDLLASAAVLVDKSSKDEGKGPVTAAALLNEILYKRHPIRKNGKIEKEYPICRLARKYSVVRFEEDPELRIAADRITLYFDSVEPRQERFVRQIIERSLSELTSKKWTYLSGNDGKAGSLYWEIIHKHRVVSVAVGQSSPAFQRSMSTLVKAIFQQAVLADLTRRAMREPDPDLRPEPRMPSDEPFFLLACDEYAQAITEGASGLVSDSRFFSLAREAGCMSLLALQSVATGRSRFPAAMRDRWEGILGNVSVKFFMKLNDVETAELASALAGSRHSFVPVASQQQSAQGLVASEGVTMVEHPLVPSWFLTNRMPQGHALVHGTLDGKSAPVSIFVKNPYST
jgi:hypothetical protein